MKAFLNYCKNKKWITSYETITSPIDKKGISYFSDEEWWLMYDAIENPEIQRAMIFYYSTGCRKTEPFIAKRVGRTLIIPKMKIIL